MARARRPSHREMRNTTHLIEAALTSRTVRELIGHAEVSTTLIYTHVLNRGGLGVKSPVERWQACLRVARSP